MWTDKYNPAHSAWYLVKVAGKRAVLFWNDHNLFWSGFDGKTYKPDDVDCWLDDSKADIDLASTDKNAQKELLSIVIEQGGHLCVQPLIFDDGFCICEIKAVEFTEEYDLDNDDETNSVWNAYVNKVKATIGVDSYCHWVRSKGKMVGIMAFYDQRGNEIKTKHFDNWTLLLEKVNNEIFC